MTEAIKAYRGQDYFLNDLRTVTLHHVVHAMELGLVDRDGIDMEEVIPPCEVAEKCQGCVLHSCIPPALVGYIARFEVNCFNVPLRGTCTGFVDEESVAPSESAALLTLVADPSEDCPAYKEYPPNYRPPCGLSMVRVFDGEIVTELT